MLTTVNCIVFKTLSRPLKSCESAVLRGSKCNGSERAAFSPFRTPTRKSASAATTTVAVGFKALSLARPLCPIDRTDRHAEREKKRGEQSLPASLPPSVALLAAEPRATLRVHIRAEAGRRGTTDGHRLQIVGEERGGASAVAVRPSCLTQRAEWSHHYLLRVPRRRRRPATVVSPFSSPLQCCIQVFSGSALRARESGGSTDDTNCE